MALSSRALPDLSKLEPLNGSNYKRWSQKLLIFFEQLEVDYVLFEEAPAAPPSVTTIVVAVGGTADAPPPPPDDNGLAKYQKDNKIVRGHILNHMTNSLFDLFVNRRSAKEIWEALEKKYGGDDAGLKKYVVGKWLEFQMVDNKPIMEQLHEYENLTVAVLNEGMKLCEELGGLSPERSGGGSGEREGREVEIERGEEKMKKKK